ncbi:MAG TPA: ABC transporter substrate-binding protein [Pirellulaceae bacterium]|nr:ABC transporter substrate-binding protein [Pirellulaceae bacterium]
MEFHLHEPSAIFLQNLAMFSASIVSPTAVKLHGKAFGEHPIGTGPFQFTNWQRKQSITISTFDDHWRGPPGVARVIFLSVGDNSTRAEQLKRGESHIADDLRPADLDALARSPEFKVQEQVGLNVAYLSMQMEKPPLNHRDVRLAISHAIDKAELIRIAYGGKATSATNLCPPSMWGHNNQIQDRLFDATVGKQILAECAQREGFELPVKLTLAVMTEPRPYMPQAEQVGSFVKDSLARIGIDVTIEPRSVNQHFDYVQKGRHQLALAGWSSDNNDIDNFLFALLDDNLLDTKGDVDSNNLSRYRSEDVHKLLTAGQSELDREKRLQLYLKAQELIFADAPVVPLVHAQFRAAHTKRLLGYKLHPSQLVRLRLAHFEATK